LFEYSARVARVIDGDTFVVDVDLGFRIWSTAVSMRILGINARELHDPGGAEAKANLETLVPPNVFVTMTSVKPDKYGDRWLAKIVLPDGRDLSQTLIDQQYAAPWNGRGVKPVPPWPRKGAASE
jgi:endonuclease YncB( thermonuclease family)